MSSAPGRRAPAVRLGDVLARLARQRRWDQRLEQEAAVAAWPAVVGEELARLSVALCVRGGILHVAVRSGTWATQLTFFRTDLVRRLRAAGITAVRDIAFRVGLPPGSPADRISPGVPRKAAPPPTSEEVATARQLREAAGNGDLAEGLARLYLAAVARRKRLQAAEPPR